MGFFQDQLKAAGDSFFSSEYLRDFQHASKTFQTNGYAYAPKFKFLFHVYFDINKTGIGQFGNFPADSNFGLAVKSIQLPKFNIDTHVLNQYNRKRIVQSKIKYDPVNITFHDDNNNLIRKLWYAYYTYYYKDSTHPDPNAELTGPPAPPAGNNPAFLDRNIYNPNISGNDDWGYVGETAGTQSLTGGDSKVPFFNAINIYGFNQHNFALYRLMNPIIESFGHDTYNYADASSTMENQMTLQFETVKYFEGALNGKNPGQLVKEFGDASHYDTMLSPIARPGSQATIMGPGGLVDAGEGILDDLASGNWLGAAQKAGTAYKTFKGKDLAAIGKQEAMNAARNTAQNTPNRNVYNFPSGNL
jgi:hypothetical protein